MKSILYEEFGAVEPRNHIGKKVLTTEDTKDTKSTKFGVYSFEPFRSFVINEIKVKVAHHPDGS